MLWNALSWERCQQQSSSISLENVHMAHNKLISSSSTTYTTTSSPSSSSARTCGGQERRLLSTKWCSLGNYNGSDRYSCDSREIWQWTANNTLNSISHLQLSIRNRISLNSLMPWISHLTWVTSFFYSKNYNCKNIIKRGVKCKWPGHTTFLIESPFYFPV